MIGISACLGGICCRYDGKSQELRALKKLIEKNQALAICPEVMGNLTIPREPAEIIGGDGTDVWRNTAYVLTKSGKNVTEAYKRGAILAYEKLAESKIQNVIMKENSPSCGKNSIYDGTFSGVGKNGLGVATAYFLRKGITVVSEKEWQSQQLLEK